MNSADLHRAVQAALASKRLGTPVFVRYLFHVSGKGASILRRLTEAAAAALGWLGQDLERLHAVGSLDARAISLTLECRQGATALVSWAGTTPIATGIDLTVIGNHGALFHDVGAGNLWEREAAAAPAEVDKKLLGLIEKALASGAVEQAP